MIKQGSGGENKAFSGFKR